MKVKDMMSSPVFSLRETDTLHSAREMMQMQRIRHIPIVTADNTFIGLITHRDLLSATISHLAEVDPDTQREIDSGIPIQEIMRTDLKSISPDEHLGDAAKVLLNHKYGCLPVVEKGKLVGIITEADFLKLTIQLLEALDNDA
ncbi:CBS domain-containing protein [Paucidesulfovibrio longus]|uniref:CBS domain-containing protein n=1 Tax=Paucidesulfovibrio longus TaxID=889 RepID=UPI0003B4436B|nr:CBS domain-containing protein [Paucidesulfovibrio longus]